MSTITLRAGEAEATIAPAYGANCLSARVGGRDLLEGPPTPETLTTQPVGFGCPILFPFPGQLEPGRLTLLGREVRVAANGPSGRHGHGFAPRRPWRLVDRTNDACTCQLEGRGDEFYPWWFRLTARWRLTSTMIAVGLTVENLDDSDMPFGLGLHPYIPVDDDATIEVPAAAAWPHDGGIPSGPPAPTSGGARRWGDLDAPASVLLTELPGGDVEARAGGVVLRWPGDRFGEVVLYRPAGRASVCVEPWTSVSNAAAQLEPGRAQGLVQLAPTARWTAWMEIAPAD